jgi:aminodeoxychorismate synthase component I
MRLITRCESRQKRKDKLTIFTAELNGWVDPADAFIQFFEKSKNSFWFDRENSPTRPLTIMGSGEKISSEVNFPGSETRSLPADLVDLDLPFLGGTVGFMTFEGSGSWIRVDRAIYFDHLRRKLIFVADVESERDFFAWQHAAYLRLALVGGEQVRFKLENPIPEPKAVSLRHSKTEYIERIHTALAHIAAGDVYQLCLTNELEIDTEAHPLAVFLELRQQNSAPYSAYLKLDDIALVSSSPELFLQLSDGKKLTTKPIKGTRPRSSNHDIDLKIADELRSNEKERAENLMIVDLMRNDLARVSQAESVAVEKLFDVESYATVHQLVSTVVSEIRSDATVFEALEALFPGGSMTGAPKLKAIEIIRQLEEGARGVYSGAFGWVSNFSEAEFAMTIRSIIFSSGKATVGVGGGITIDSDPAAEFEETRLKAKALLNVLRAPEPW